MRDELTGPSLAVFVEMLECVEPSVLKSIRALAGELPSSSQDFPEKDEEAPLSRGKCRDQK